MTTTPQTETDVLLVEDHGMLRRVLARTLTEAGYRVTEAGNGGEALVLLQGGLRPRLLLSDVRMPGQLNGLELARRARDILPAIPVILTTGHNDLSVHEFRLLLKPFTPDQLLGDITQLLA